MLANNLVILLANIPLLVQAKPTPRAQQNLTSGCVPLPIYRNASRCVEDRVEDLLQRMTVEEKAGQMFHSSISMGQDYTLFPGSETANSTDNLLLEKLMSHFNLGAVIQDARKFANWHNLLQERALTDRLGIPISLSTDPRHGFSEVLGASIGTGALSRWPESLGFAALRDADLVYKYADIAREEYISLGFRGALHPQVDLSTEPRWARIFHTWGENATLTSELLVAYIKGFHGTKIGPTSVTTVTKHFPGGGAMENGEDSHFPQGKNQTYPGNNMDYHLIPFKAAIAAGARQMMPYYSRPIGTQYKEIGFSFNREIVTDLLREQLGFEGIVVTDWGLITDGSLRGIPWPARAWGVEELSELQRAQMIIEAGCDQFGGETRPELLVELVEKGLVKEERLDTSVRRLLREKFLLGLFDEPFIDPDVAERVVGNPYFKRLGFETQRRSYTLLTNNNDILPIHQLDKKSVYVEGINSTVLEARNFLVVNTPEEADVALLRLQPPFDPRKGTLPGEFGHRGGSLEYTQEEKARQAAIYKAVPTIVDIYTDRPIAIPEVAEHAAALFANFGSSDEAFLDVVMGIGEPEGKLPFDLPRSNAAVDAQYEDVPFDTVDPVFKFGHGLTYNELC